MFEEYFHVTGDNPVDFTNIKYIQTTLPDLPDSAKLYFYDRFNILDENDFQTYYNNKFRISFSLNEPNYYWNEVNANTKTKELMYDQLSEFDRSEIDYKIWFYTEMAKNAEKYF